MKAIKRYPKDCDGYLCEALWSYGALLSVLITAAVAA